MRKLEIIVERVLEPTPDIATDIGKLMPDLSARFTEEPVAEDTLRQIIEPPDRDLLVAIVNGRIVGSAVMNLIIFASGKKAWLEDFVVAADEDIRGKGVGYALWREVMKWSEEREAPLEFTSSPLRERAHEFYNRQGAEIKPTAVFHLDTSSCSNPAP